MAAFGGAWRRPLLLLFGERPGGGRGRGVRRRRGGPGPGCGPRGPRGRRLGGAVRPGGLAAGGGGGLGPGLRSVGGDVASQLRSDRSPWGLRRPRKLRGLQPRRGRRAPPPRGTGRAAPAGPGSLSWWALPPALRPARALGPVPPPPARRAFSSAVRPRRPGSFREPAGTKGLGVTVDALGSGEAASEERRLRSRVWPRVFPLRDFAFCLS